MGLNAYFEASAFTSSVGLFFFSPSGHVGGWVVRWGTLHTSRETPSQGCDVTHLAFFADGSSLQWEMVLEGDFSQECQ